MEELEFALNKIQDVRGSVASESAVLQTKFERILSVSQEKEALLTSTVNTIKEKYTSIIMEATEKANSILATAEKSAAESAEKASLSLAASKLTAAAEMKIAAEKSQALMATVTEGRKAWAAEQASLSDIQKFQSKIKLDVGGVKHTTSLTTLRRFPDTMIGAMFSGRHALPLDEDGYHFIDRDGTQFRYILNFLRCPEFFECDLTGAALKELKNECEYYGLKDFMFPFIPIPPFQTRTVANVLITVTQDQDGVYRICDIAVRVCEKCGAAGPYKHPKVGDDYIANFVGVVWDKGGEIYISQPRIAFPCFMCAKYLH